MARFTTRLTYANVMATIAVFIALGGSGYAAIKLPKNSVKSTQIKNGQVKNGDLGANSVTSSKVKNGSLLSTDFKAGQLPAGATGAPGTNGTNGAKGDKGDKGDTGTFGAVTVARETLPADLPDGTDVNIDVYCPAGQRAIGGGVRGDDTLAEATIIGSTRPAISSTNTEPPVSGGTFTGWRATVVNPAGGATNGIRPDVWAICTDG